MRQIRRIGVLQTAKVLAVLYFVLGALIFIPIGLIQLATGQAGKGPLPVVVVFLFPLLYGIGGFVAVVMMCWLYNVVAGWLGGVAIELDREGPP